MQESDELTISIKGTAPYREMALRELHRMLAKHPEYVESNIAATSSLDEERKYAAADNIPCENERGRRLREAFHRRLFNLFDGMSYLDIRAAWREFDIALRARLVLKAADAEEVKVPV